jgi:hypothetical protein
LTAALNTSITALNTSTTALTSQQQLYYFGGGFNTYAATMLISS